MYAKSCSLGKSSRGHAAELLGWGLKTNGAVVDRPPSGGDLDSLILHSMALCIHHR